MTTNAASTAMPAVHQLQRSVTSYENHGAFRWTKPSFQAFQLRSWNKDQEAEEALRNSLGIFGPQIQSEISRAKSVPVPAREKESLVSRDDVRTAHSMAATRDLISLKPRASLEALPTRPPLSKTKQVPGRYFPKPTTSESTRVVSFSMFRRYKPPVRPRTMATGNSRSLDTNNLPLESVSFLDALPRSGRQMSPGLSRRLHRPRRAQTEIRDVKSEIFAICFNTGPAASSGNKLSGECVLPGVGETEKEKITPASYDPHSELHSDYYTIKRVTVNDSTSSKTDAKKNFSVVLRGQPKRLHPKLLFLSEPDHRPDLRGLSSGSVSLHTSEKGYNTRGRDAVSDSHDEINVVGKQNAPPPSEKINVKIDSGQEVVE